MKLITRTIEVNEKESSAIIKCFNKNNEYVRFKADNLSKDQIEAMFDFTENDITDFLKKEDYYQIPTTPLIENPVIPNVDYKVNILKEEFNEAEDNDFKKFISLSSESDPNFFRWLYEIDYLEDFQCPNEEHFDMFLNKYSKIEKINNEENFGIDSLEEKLLGLSYDFFNSNENDFKQYVIDLSNNDKMFNSFFYDISAEEKRPSNHKEDLIKILDSCNDKVNQQKIERIESNKKKELDFIKNKLIEKLNCPNINAEKAIDHIVNDIELNEERLMAAVGGELTYNSFKNEDYIWYLSEQGEKESAYNLTTNMAVDCDNDEWKLLTRDHLSCQEDIEERNVSNYINNLINGHSEIENKGENKNSLNL